MNHAENQALHSENFDLCRICLLEPESNRNILFYPVFGDDERSAVLRQKIIELLQVKIEKNDVKPKIICSNCRDSILTWSEMKKKAGEAQIVVNYIAKKRFGSTTLNQSISDGGVSSDSKNNTVSTTASQLSYSQNLSKLPNHFETRPISQSNNYVDNSQRDRSSARPLITNHLTPVSVSQSNNYAGNNQQDRSSARPSITNHSTPISGHESDDNTSCHAVEIPNEVIYVSSDSEDYEDEFKRNPSGSDVIRYCSICKVKKKYNHDCSAYNKEFSTCLVPNCNVLCRKLRDFDPHYRQHIGFSSREWVCRRCFKENKKSERDADGRHICRNTENVFKCYICNIKLNSMLEFANHKLKKHNGRLINSSGKFLCFYCEKSFSDLKHMDEHIKEMHYKKNKNGQENDVTKHKDTKVTETVITKNEKTVVKKAITDPGVEKVNQVVERSYKQMLFTCLKPNCNLIFHYFPNFKYHHRLHFNTGNKVMCWQCCTPFIDVTSLRVHQVKDNCRVPGMFKCYECHEKFNNIQCLSVHKFTVHNGELIIQKKGQKSAVCPSCRTAISSSNFRGHLIQCYPQNNKNAKNIKTIGHAVPKIVLKKSKLNTCKCGICGRVCLTAAALSSHIKVHNPNRDKKKVSTKTNGLDTTTVAKDGEINSTLSSFSQNNETSISDNQIIDVVNVVSSTSNTCTTNAQRFVDYDQFPCSNGVYTCIQCPRKFTTKMGLAKHWPFCRPKKIVYTKEYTSRVDTRKILPKNYYCTDCKEYFTRVGFGSHFLSVHKKKLGLNKTKRYSCTKCPLKFLYKMALLMHYQHAHGALESSKTSNTADDDTLNSVNDSVNLPVVSETTSLATDHTEELVGIIEENCDQRIKKEIDHTNYPEFQLDSFDDRQDKNLSDSNVNEDLVNGYMNNAPSVTESVEIEVGELDPENAMEVDKHDSENAMEVEEHEPVNAMEEGNTNEIEINIEATDSGENIESLELDKNNEVSQIDKDNSAHELEENTEVNELGDNNDPNFVEEISNINVTTTNDDINMGIVKNEFTLTSVNMNETQYTNQVVNNSKVVDQEHNNVINSKVDKLEKNIVNGS